MGCFPVLPAVRTRKRTTDTDSKVCRRKPTKINWNFSKKCLTNSQECAIIKAQRGKQGRSRRQDPRESCKTLTIKSSTARCVGLRNSKCEPEPVRWRNAGLCLLQSNKGRRAFSVLPPPLLSLNCKRLGVCPPPMNGVECQRIHDIGERGFLLFPPFAPFYFQSRAHGPGARYFHYNTAPAICQ